MPQASPRLSVVVLTWNEERNIASCLRALARQTERDFEVRIIDAASPDQTVAVAKQAIREYPGPVDLYVASRRLSVGEARNLGVQGARAPAVAFLSADADPDPEWVAQALQSLESHELVFGRQIHEPHSRTVGAAVRGLRYHFPDQAIDDPERYASNVNAAFRKPILEAFPFGTTAGESAVDDLLLTRRATQAGHRVAYNPRMVVRHHDVESWRAELVKNHREGLGWGEHASELGSHRAILSWGALLAVSVALALFIPTPITVIALAALLWMPALRRAWRRRRQMPARDLAVGVLASPLFDLAFLLAYLRGRLSIKPTPAPRIQHHEVKP